jgi:hypothetical protein
MDSVSWVDEQTAQLRQQAARHFGAADRHWAAIPRLPRGYVDVRGLRDGTRGRHHPRKNALHLSRRHNRMGTEALAQADELERKFG